MVTAFGTLFLAEMGDKTQLAIMALAAESKRPASVFVGGAAALIVVSALGAVAGGFVSRWVPEIWIRRVAGAAFVLVGAWMLLRRDA